MYGMQMQWLLAVPGSPETSSTAGRVVEALLSAVPGKAVSWPTFAVAFAGCAASSKDLPSRVSSEFFVLRFDFLLSESASDCWVGESSLWSTGRARRRQGDMHSNQHTALMTVI